MLLEEANAFPASKILGKKRQREDKDNEEDSDLESKLDSRQVKKIKHITVEDSNSDKLNVDDNEDNSEAQRGNDVVNDDDSEHKGDTDEGSPKKQFKSQDKSAEQSEDLLGQIDRKLQMQPSLSHVLIFNITNLNEKELQDFLAKCNVPSESISIISSPVAMLGFSDENAAKNAKIACSGAAYGKSTIAAITVSGDDTKMVQSDLNLPPSSSASPLTCLFVTLLPKSVTQREILEIIGVEPEHLRLVTSGPKNQTTNACYIDCKSEEDAQHSLRVVQDRLFDGKHVKAYLKPRININPVTECSFVAANVPFNVGVDDMKKEFPSAEKIEPTRKGCFMLSFDSVETRSKVLKESEGKVMEGRILRFITTEISPISSLQSQEKEAEKQKSILKKGSVQAGGESNSDEEKEGNNTTNKSDEEVDGDKIDNSNVEKKDNDDVNDGNDEDGVESISKPPKQQNRPAKFNRDGGFQHRGGRGNGQSFQHRGSRGGFQPRGGNGGFQPRGGNGGFQPYGGRGGFQPRGGSDGFQPRGGNGGFQPRGGNGGFQPYGGRGGFQPRGGSDGFQPYGGRGGFQPRGGSDGFQPRGGNGGFQHRGGSGGFQNRGGRCSSSFQPRGGRGRSPFQI